jgi:hypothetical protein
MNSANIAARLRIACRGVRTKSYSLADLIPLMQQAADALEAHVQNPAKIEHVAGDVSKTPQKSNMAQAPAVSRICNTCRGTGIVKGLHNWLNGGTRDQACWNCSPAQAPAVPAWKDNDTAKLVNDLRDVAIEFHDSQQLRERIAQIVRPIATLMAQAPAVPADWPELQRLANCCPELNLNNYGPDDVDELNAWAIEVSLCIARTAAAPQPEADEAMRKDAERYRWLRAEHDRVDPVCHLMWKRNSDRNSSEWVNTARLDDSVDAAKAAQGGV